MAIVHTFDTIIFTLVVANVSTRCAPRSRHKGSFPCLIRVVKLRESLEPSKLVTLNSCANLESEFDCILIGTQFFVNNR